MQDSIDQQMSESSLYPTTTNETSYYDLKQLTRNILSRKKEGIMSKQGSEQLPLFFERDLFSSLALAPLSSLRRNFISSGMLCKDCHRYMARTHYSVCKLCFQKRVRKFVKSGGFYVLTDKARKQLEDELRV
jgi:hypothetical protein